MSRDPPVSRSQSDSPSSPRRTPGWALPGRVEKAQYRWHASKPFYVFRLSVLEPPGLSGQIISGRLYSTTRALWKLGWFLRDFAYDAELLGRDEVDERAMLGLRGVVKVSHTVVNGTALLNFDGFAPAEQWEQQLPAPASQAPGHEVA